MPWSLLSDTPTPPDGTEQWAIVTLPAPAGLLNYAFRVAVPDVTPQAWNTLGYWGVGQVVDDRAIVSQTHVIPLIGRGAPQVLRLVGANDVDVAVRPGTSLFIAYYIHRWIESSTFELYGSFAD